MVWFILLSNQLSVLVQSLYIYKHYINNVNIRYYEQTRNLNLDQPITDSVGKKAAVLLM